MIKFQRKPFRDLHSEFLDKKARALGFDSWPALAKARAERKCKCGAALTFAPVWDNDLDEEVCSSCGTFWISCGCRPE